MKNQLRGVIIAACAAVLFSSGSASAQGATEPPGYDYRFDDDDLVGGTLDSTPPIIRGGKRPMRVMLIRPRASFIGEMLKSVENL